MATNDKEKRKEWDRKYREKNKEKIKAADEKFRKSDKRKEYLREYRKTDKFKDYKKKWEKNNPEKKKEYDRNWVKNNTEKVREKYKKYYYTSKGTATMLRKHDARRLGVKKSKLTWQIIEKVNKRDKKCVYCKNEFNNDIEYDHINPFKPFSKNNIVRACSNCNKDKSRANMIEWMNFKKYEISKKLQELYKKAYS